MEPSLQPSSSLHMYNIIAPYGEPSIEPLLLIAASLAYIQPSQSLLTTVAAGYGEPSLQPRRPVMCTTIVAGYGRPSYNNDS
jgi:hypothetical protein